MKVLFGTRQDLQRMPDCRAPSNPCCGQDVGCSTHTNRTLAACNSSQPLRTKADPILWRYLSGTTACSPNSIPSIFPALLSIHAAAKRMCPTMAPSSSPTRETPCGQFVRRASITLDSASRPETRKSTSKIAFHDRVVPREFGATSTAACGEGFGPVRRVIIPKKTPRSAG
jgi:hypothetical protein